MRFGRDLEDGGTDAQPLADGQVRVAQVQIDQQIVARLRPPGFIAGEEGERNTVLSSPIILYDHPRIAPESPGDLFDATEIDQLLTLGVLCLTEDEQREIRDGDPRAREILDRCASLPPEHLMRLHGALREFRPLTGQGAGRE